MFYRRFLWLPVLAGTLAAQYGTPPKPSAQDYPVHANVGGLSIGAEYLVHSFSSGRDMFIAIGLELAFGLRRAEMAQDPPHHLVSIRTPPARAG